MSRRLSAGLLTGCVVLGGIVYAEFRMLDDISGPVAVRGASGEAPAVSAATSGPLAISLPGLDGLEDTVDRPLFTQGRRPPPENAPVPVAVGTTATAAPAVPFALSGIVLADSERFALVAGAAKGGPQRLRVGEKLDGWTLTAINELSVTMTSGSNTQEVLLRKYEAPARAAPRTRRKPAATSASADAAGKRASPRQVTSPGASGASGTQVNSPADGTRATTPRRPRRPTVVVQPDN